MSSKSLLILCCFLLVAFYNTVSSQSVVTVVPTASIEESADSTSTERYLTLAQYLNNASDSVVFNTSNTTIEFVPGEHDIDGLSVRQVVIFGVSNIIWRGFPTKQSVLKCKQEFTLIFVFREVINLMLSDLTLENCIKHNIL